MDTGCDVGDAVDWKLGMEFPEKTRFFFKRRAQATRSNDSFFSFHIKLVSKYFTFSEKRQ